MKGYIEAQRAYDRQEPSSYYDGGNDCEYQKVCDYDPTELCCNCKRCYGYDEE